MVLNIDDHLLAMPSVTHLNINWMFPKAKVIFGID